MENKPSGGRFIAALLFFATTAGIAILLLLTALVIWLSSVTGSFIASALIAGGFFAVLALLVYLFAIRDAVEQIKKLKKDSLITEDEQRKAEDDGQKITDKAIKDIDGTCAGKEKEIMEV